MKSLAIKALFGSLFFTHMATAQDALAVCEALTNYRLIDVKIESEARSVARGEFDLYCSDRQNLLTSMNSKSRSFSGSFADTARDLGLSGGSASSGVLTHENIEQVCDEGYSSFVENYTRSLQESSGSALAETVRQCVATVVGANTDYIWGSIELLDDGRNILATIERSAPIGAPVLKFAGLNPASRYTNCRVGTSDALEKKLVKSLSVSCEVNLAVAEATGAESVQGSILFSASNDDLPQVTFKAIRGDVVAEFKDGILAQLNEKVALLEVELAKKADQMTVDTSIASLAADTAAKLRPVAEQYTIWFDVPDPALVSWSEGPGHQATGKPLMPASQGFCALNQLSTESSGAVKWAAGVAIKDGNWFLAVYSGYTSPRGWYAGATCWRFG